jgi:hypothetical protein
MQEDGGRQTVASSGTLNYELHQFSGKAALPDISLKPFHLYAE